MTDELRQAFRLYDKEQHGYISTLVLKVILSSSHITNTAIFSITIIIDIAIIIIITRPWPAFGRQGLDGSSERYNSNW